MPAVTPEVDSPVAGVEVIASALQLDLERLGYRPGSVTGTLTADTQDALRRFQTDAKVAAAEHGAIGPSTAAALAARLHGSPDAVLALQSALTDVGLFDAAINGRYDAATITAVKALQTRARIATDGFYGPQTEAALVRLYRRRSRASEGRDRRAEPDDHHHPDHDDHDHDRHDAGIPSAGRAEAREYRRVGETASAAADRARLPSWSCRWQFRWRHRVGGAGLPEARGLARDSDVGPAVEAALADPKATAPLERSGSPDRYRYRQATGVRGLKTAR